MDLQQTLTKARGGDESAREELFRYLHVRFSVVAKRRIGEQDAEDIVHDACVTVLEKYRSLAPDVQFEAWAYKVLRNKIGSYLRNLAVRHKAVDTTGRIDGIGSSRQPEIDPELRMRLILCLRKVTRVYPDYARALNLVNLGYKTREICQRLNVRPNHLYVMLHRCRSWLGDCVMGGPVGDER